MMEIFVLVKKNINISKLCCRKKPHFGAAFFRVLLICVSSFLSVCFKFVTTTTIESETFMFYATDQHGFGGWWFFGCFGIVGVLALFLFIFVKIKKQSPMQRYANDSVYRKVVRSFDPNHWYFEFIIFARRFCIALFAAIQFVAGYYSNVIFMIFLLLFLILQIHFKPFANSRMNCMEVFCLLSLIIVFVTANYVASNRDDGMYASVILSICMIAPFLTLLWHCYFSRRDRKQQKQLTNDVELCIANEAGTRSPPASALAKDDTTADVTAAATQTNGDSDGDGDGEIYNETKL
mmetsp:Transcript_22308/g.35812  ORF Transcript_22308/g.35812 Transcript_22308/m.35812 type:complete len:293 (+) Transcript_22308:116-994(+)